jgi:hypothetical protein
VPPCCYTHPALPACLQVLRRGLGFTTLPDGSYANIDEVATDIDWHPGRSLLVREVAQGGKKGKVCDFGPPHCRLLVQWTALLRLAHSI